MYFESVFNDGPNSNDYFTLLGKIYVKDRTAQVLLDIREVIEIHGRAKTKVNLSYKRKNGMSGHCYIDPTKPLRWKRNADAYPGDPGLEYLLATKDEVLVGLYKQTSKAEIWVKPCDVSFQNPKRAAASKILYGEKT